MINPARSIDDSARWLSRVTWGVAHPPPWWTFHPAEPGVVFRVKKSQTASRRTVSKKVFAGAMSVLTKCLTPISGGRDI
jgi:hypothetical protein